jgi:hypothetical protein
VSTGPNRAEEQADYVISVCDDRAQRREIASKLSRQEALEVARYEAAARGLGYMFLAGSEAPRDVVVIADSDEAI